MKIRMLETRRGSEDCFTLKRYYQGLIYEVADSQAITFIRNRLAISLEPEESLEDVVAKLCATLNCHGLNTSIIWPKEGETSHA